VNYKRIQHRPVVHILRDVHSTLALHSQRGLVESDFALQIISLPLSEAVKFITIHVEHFAKVFIG